MTYTVQITYGDFPTVRSIATTILVGFLRENPRTALSLAYGWDPVLLPLLSLEISQMGLTMEEEEYDDM